MEIASGIGVPWLMAPSSTTKKSNAMVGSGSPDFQHQSGKFTSQDARARGFLAIPLRAIRDYGQASQALAGILVALRSDGKRTFRRQESLARCALLPERTFRRHLALLEQAGAVRVSREPNQTSVTSLAHEEAHWMEEGFLPLPRGLDGLTWCERLVYSWVVFRAELSLDQATCEDSVGRMTKALGIARRSVFNALEGLVAKGLIDRSCDLVGSHGRSSLVNPGSNPPQETSAKVAGALVQKWPEPGAKVASPSMKKGIKKNSGQKGSDQKHFQREDIEGTASSIFRRSGYSGDDGALYWLLAALVVSGRLSEHDLEDAIQGAKECSARNRPAYTRAILRNRIEDFDSLVRSVRITPVVPTRAPESPQDARKAPRATFRSV